MIKTVHINVGNCGQCKQGTREGELFDIDKFHNCSNCGYYNSYNQEMIKYDAKTLVITFSTVAKPQVPYKSMMPEYINPSLKMSA